VRARARHVRDEGRDRLIDYGRLLTEQSGPDPLELDTLKPIEVVDALLAAEAQAARAIRGERRKIAAAAVLIARTIKAGGRLVYAGAGTSGRLGVLDAAECVPTFSVPPSMIEAVIAGGPRAVFRSVEGAEDDPKDADRRMRRVALDQRDVLCAIAASGVTPFTLHCLEYARARRAATIFVTCADLKPKAMPVADIVVNPRVGPEVLAGSTRLKAGTATKVVLNTLSTTAMIGIGKVYGHLMVDLRPTNAKLKARALRMIVELCEVSPREAADLLAKAGGRVKLAIVMHHRAVPAPRAKALLLESGDRLRTVIGDVRVTRRR
jgi:N-acetylmuramic acid 6-phosphate etherase